LGRIDAYRHAEQSAAALERGVSSAVGEEAKVADANQAAGQHVKQESAQELVSGNGHDLLLAAVGIVSPSERDAIVLESHEAMVESHEAMVLGWSAA
jgi:ribonuclease HII